MNTRWRSSRSAIEKPGSANDWTVNRAVVARFNSNGGLDPTFNHTGVQAIVLATTQSWFQAVALTSDGKVLAAGYTNDGIAIARFNADGTLDTTFGSSATGELSISLGGSFLDSAGGIVPLSDGGTLVSIVAHRQGQADQFGLVRLQTGNTLQVLPGATGAIGGRVFADANHNGTMEPSETGLGGVTVYLDANDNGALDPGEISTTTNPDGSYVFTGLPPGPSMVREQVPAGNVLTAPLGYAATVDVLVNQSAAGPVFGNVPIASVAMDFTYLMTLARHYGQPGTFAVGDLNGDGMVNFADLMVVARNYGHPLTALSSAASGAIVASVQPTVAIAAQFAPTITTGEPKRPKHHGGLTRRTTASPRAAAHRRRGPRRPGLHR